VVAKLHFIHLVVTSGDQPPEAEPMPQEASAMVEQPEFQAK
jgi:hypothetical protein